MTSISPRPVYVLRLTPERCTDPAEGTRRLRAALKCLLRSYGLRCLSVLDERPQPPAPESEVEQ